MQKGRFEETEKVLKRLHAKKGEIHHEQAIREFVQMKKQLELDQTKEIRRFEIVKTAPNRRRLLVALILTWGSTFTGPLVIANYGIILFIQLGLSGYMPLMLLGLWTTIAIPGNLVTALFVDRLGRRTSLSTESILAIIGVVINLPPALLILWRLFGRRRTPMAEIVDMTRHFGHVHYS